MDSVPPELRAFNNELILEVIFKNLSTTTLLSCRLVNTKWNKIACDILKHRPVYLTMTSWTESKFQELQNICSNLNFPVTGFKIADRYRICDVKNAAVEQFFNDFGTMFTRVYLADYNVLGRIGMLTLLEQFLPNVEEVTLKNVQIEYVPLSGPWWHIRREKDLLLPNVRQINLKGHLYEGVVGQFLLGAPNLEVISGLISYDIVMFQGILEELVEKNKLSAVTTLFFEDSQVGLNSGIYQSLALQPPALTELTLIFRRGNVSPEFEQCVKAILIASEKTLRKLTMEPPKISLNDIPVVFSKLHNLELGIYEERTVTTVDEDEAQILSPGLREVNPVEKFPAVKQISLLLQKPPKPNKTHFVTGTREMLEEHFFKPGIVWNTVDTLELHDHYSPDGFQYLAQVFPNVTRVIINFTHAGFTDIEAAKRTPSDVWCVRKFPNLRKLVIVDFPPSCKNLSLDDFLTGIPKSIREGLQPPLRHTSQADDDQLYRPYGGLVELRETGLRELEFLFSECNPSADYPIMSQEAVWYGLQVISDLITTYKAPVKAKNSIAQALEHLRPQVGVEYY